MNDQRQYKIAISRDVLLLQHHWMEMGKPLHENMSQSEYMVLCCDRLSVPVRKSAIASLYKKFCTASHIDTEMGASLPQTVGMLEHTRKLSLHMENKVDPCDVIWNILLQHNAKLDQQQHSPVYDSDGSDSSTMKKRENKKKSGSPSKGANTVTAAAFLAFLQSQQKLTKATMQQVKDIFESLNSIAAASQIMDDGVTVAMNNKSTSTASREIITKATFMNYLLSDSNDAFDPSRGTWEQDDMTQPLCSYWINASHDTYLNNVPPQIANDIYTKNFSNCPMSVKMYATALYRGCRSLDLDVWDGKSSLIGQPVIQLHSEHKSCALGDRTDSHGNYPEQSKPIPFCDVLWLVRSFLNSNPQTLPVILFIENHCSVANQDKMAKDIHTILGNNDMVYIPSDGVEGEILPSPHEMRGKAVIKFKIASLNSPTCAFDDHDEDLDIDFKTMSALGHTEDDEFETLDIVEDDNGKSARELVAEATKELTRAKVAAKKADTQLFDVKIKASKAKEVAQGLLKQANMTPKDAEKEKKRREEAANPKIVVKKQKPPSPNTKSSSKKTKTPPSQQSWGAFFFGEQKDTGSVASEDEESSDDEDIAWGESVYSDSSDEDEDFDGKKKDVDGDADAEESLAVNLTMSDDESAASDVSDDRSAGWVDSSPEYRQYKFASSNKKQKEESKDIQEIQRKINGFKEHTEEGAIEVEHHFMGGADHDLMGYSEAEIKNEKASEILNSATELLKKCQKEFEHANQNFAQARMNGKHKNVKAKKRKAELENKMKRGQTELEKATNDASMIQQELKSLQATVEQLCAKEISARTVAETAVSEAEISEDRAIEIEQRSKRAAESVNVNMKVAEEETKKQESLGQTLSTEQKVCAEVTKKFKAQTQKWQVIVDAVEKTRNQITKIEKSSQYRKEKEQAESGRLEDGPTLKKHKKKIDEKFGLEEKLHKAARDKRIADDKKNEAEKYLATAMESYNMQARIADKARQDADNVASLAEQLAEQLDGDQEASKMRSVASRKAMKTLEDLNADITKKQSQIEALEKKSQDAFARQANLENDSRGAKETFDGNQFVPSEHDGLDDYLAVVEKKRKQLRSAEMAYKKALEAHEMTEQDLEKAREVLNKNADANYKAKIASNVMESKLNAEARRVEKALAAYERYMKLVKEADKAAEHASKSHSIAADKAVAQRRSQDYSKQKSYEHPISMALSDLTLLHSVKFKNFEKSQVLPLNHLHNLSEGKIYQICQKGHREMEDLIQFNKTHMTRVFPSKHEAMRLQSSNFNPVLAWSLGCQVASMNQQVCDAYILVNDGRFRVNGSCGYVLKPGSMIESKGGDIRRRRTASLPRRWNIKILSGYNLPKPRSKALSGTINPHIRVTLYDGGQNELPVVHMTNALKRNGLNPIWDETEGANFKVHDPSTAIILVSLWDVEEENGVEDFIAAAAIPISCMRQGYRSIPLFDANHMRCGAHASSMLLARIDAK